MMEPQVRASVQDAQTTANPEVARSAGRGVPLMFSIPQTAALLGISRALAYDLARRGDLPTIRLGRRWLVPRADLAAFLARANVGVDA